MGTQRLIADRYSLVEPLPGSATGIGWRAQDLWSGQLVAITRVPVSGLVGDELLRARHEIGGEVRALGGLQHDRLTRTMDVVLDADDLWVASELLPGVTMADELARRGVVGPEDAARWGRDVADGLAAAHRAGVSHRNLHAGMVGIAADGRAVVGGFATTVVTPEGLRNGTPVHVAPEVARGAKPSAASDVFALGAMLYLAVEGRGPFLATADRDQLLAAVAFAVAAPLRAGRLSGPLMRMLHPDLAQRPAAAAVADQLRQLAAVPGDGGSMITRLEPGPPAGVPAPPGPASVGPPPHRAPLPWVAPPPGPGMPQPPGPGLPPTVTDPSAGQRKRVWWVVAAAVVAVLWLMGSLLVVFGPPWMWGLPGRPAAAPAPPPPIGDPRTADPCSLLSVDSAQRFGQVTISREAARTGRCGRTVVLGDRSRVYVTAWAFRGAAADLCAVADAGTQTAVSALSSGSLPQPSCPPA